ncbi:unnamed protein product [Phytophthora fragariaefolia]|uniref:Unnamed protein product n=1 Tax=Phytophthora fragariaefolia TaxID=1490495 RepID=A0A9W6YG45_9STRA|nr:unnamed protein product [Phytophthora fragariaefolia]
MSSDGTGIRRLPVVAECLSDRHSVKSDVLLLKTSTRTQLVTVSAFAYRANAMNTFLSGQKLSDCTGVQAGIPCAVPMGIACEHCHVGAVRVSEGDTNGYTGVRVTEELTSLRTNWIAQMSLSTVVAYSTLPRAVGDYSARSSFTPFDSFGGGGLRTPSPFPERPASGRSAAPTYCGPEEILSNEYENDQGP